VERIDREGISSWDLRLDGRRRFDVPVTVVFDPAVGAFVWLHMAPPIGDGLRRSYRKLLRWNDEFPFVKFSLTADDRPIAAVEIPPGRLDGDALGLGIAAPRHLRPAPRGDGSLDLDRRARSGPGHLGRPPGGPP
jgi:hypothetical protein